LTRVAVHIAVLLASAGLFAAQPAAARFDPHDDQLTDAGWTLTEREANRSRSPDVLSFVDSDDCKRSDLDWHCPVWIRCRGHYWALYTVRAYEGWWSARLEKRSRRKPRWQYVRFAPRGELSR
jgi:hypothetical protein